MGRQLEEINFNLIQLLQTIEIIFLLDNNQKPLKTIINNKLAALNLSGYNAQMIMNRAEAMSCGG
jgi:hypothetical protein